MTLKAMKLRHTMLAACLTAAAASSVQTARALTIEQYCDPEISAPASVKDMTPMADGVSYACISDDGKAIEIYSYKTGALTGTLFSTSDLRGDVKIEEFDGYSLSDDNLSVLLWTDVEKIYRHSFRAEYYVYDTRRKTLKRVSEGGFKRGAVLSHDGRMVAYQRGNNIFISNLDYGTDIAVTKDGEPNKIIYGTPDWGYEEEFGVINTMRWSADDSVLSFLRFDESEVPAYSFDIYRSYCDANPEGDLYPEAYTYKYPLAGYPNSVVSVWSYNVSSRAMKRMELPVGEKDYIPSLEYIADSHDMMAMILNRDQNRMTLYKVNDASTVGRAVKEFTSPAWLSPQAYNMVRYSASSFVIGSEESGYRHLYEYDYSGKLLRQLTSGDFNVTDYYGYDAKKRVHYLRTTSLGAINRNVCSVDRSGKLTLLHPQEGEESAWFSSNFEYYLRKWSSATVPPQYTIWRADGKKLVDVELNAEYAVRYAAAPKMEFMKVCNDAGDEMDAYMIRPADFDASKKYPLLMYQYNGPDSQEVLNRWRMEGIFYIASQGYVVAAVGGRGTGGRSRSWANAVYKHLGRYETADQLAGAAHFAALPFVDADRTACFGWSYGGYMTLMELTDPKCRFKCGVAMAAVTDWRYYDSIYTERYMLTPQQNEAGYEEASALRRTESLHTPLLIMSGTSDDNVHFYNTLKYTSKLNYEGKLFDMMALAGFEHSLRMCNARTRLFAKITDWLGKNL